MNPKAVRNIEKQVLRKLLEIAKRAGASWVVNNGEFESPRTSDVEETIEKHLFATDDEWILFSITIDGESFSPSVYLVHGNDGPDVICDYSVSAERPFMRELEEWIDRKFY